MAVVNGQKIRGQLEILARNFLCLRGYDVLNRNIIKTGVTKLRSVFQSRTLSETVVQLFVKKF